jgi:hypothetical protein
MPRFPRIFWADVQAAESARDKVKPDQPGVPSAFTPPAPEIERFAPSKWGDGVTRTGRGLWLLVPTDLPALCEPTVVARRLEAVLLPGLGDVGPMAQQNLSLLQKS